MEAITHVVCNGFGFVTINPFDRVRPRRFATVRADRDASGQLLVQRMELKLFAGSPSTARDEAVCANRAKSEWLAHLSHEPRSPLNAIVGFSEVTVAQLSGRARR
jgi:two-component system cell cycle sensor histidine kinase PleC